MATNEKDVARPVPPYAGKFGFGQFGKARYGGGGSVTDVARPAETNETDVARTSMTTSARADFALADFAKADDTSGPTHVPRPK